MFVRATSALPFPLPYWVHFKIDGPVLAFDARAHTSGHHCLRPGSRAQLIRERAMRLRLLKEVAAAISSRLVNAITRVLVISQGQRSPPRS